MSNVIPFAKTETEYVLIEGGIIEKSDVPSEVGQHMFFVSVIEPEGRICLWSGQSHNRAVIEARETARDWDDIEIIDSARGRTL